MRRFYLVLATLLFFAQSSFAFDWVSLHNQADVSDLSKAERNIVLHPASLEDKYVLGLVYLDMHKDNEAGEIFETIQGIAPQMYEAEWGKAEVLRRQHKNEESEALLKEIVKTDPGFSPAYISLAYLKFRQMHFDQAIQFAMHVLGQGRDKVDMSNYVRAILIVAGSKGMIAHYGGPISKIINGTAVFPLLKKAQRLKPDDPAVLFGLGSFYLLAPSFAGGDPEKAIAYLEKAVEKDPVFADAYVRLAQANLLKGKRDKYDYYLQKAASLDAQNDLVKDIQSGACRQICVGRQ